MGLGSFVTASLVPLVLTVDFGLFHSSVRLACWGGAGFVVGGITKNFPKFTMSSGVTRGHKAYLGFVGGPFVSEGRVQ